MAPELIDQVALTTACDMWSVGVVLCLLLERSICAFPPLVAVHLEEQEDLGDADIAAIHQLYECVDLPGILSFEYSRHSLAPSHSRFACRSSDGEVRKALNLVCKMLRRCPSSRITAEQALKSPFLNPKSRVEKRKASSAQQQND